MTKGTKRIEWEARIKEWRSSGVSIARWCKENGHKDHQMYYCIQRIDESKSQPILKSSTAHFLPVKIAAALDRPNGPVFIHVDRMSVEVQPDADIHLLPKVLHVLQSY